jgi:hypothetical protein
MNPVIAKSEQVETWADSRVAKADEAILDIRRSGSVRMRSREAVSKSRVRATGIYLSSKMCRIIQCESQDELNAFRLLDADSTVTAYFERPLTIRYLQDAQIHLHHPSVLVERGHTRELWEIKSASEARRPFVAARTRVLQSALPFWGYEYRLILTKDLVPKARLTNALTYCGG